MDWAKLIAFGDFSDGPLLQISKEVAESKAVADAKTGVLTKAGNATSSLSTG
ncbi:hypothetical protein PFDG_04830 [Plasmodium falciparum Dd2]|uniref:Uncharacterized protein n=1 Tax=Plasmodium falciparum (isolate Dd2) TaxID=57267 RepID=A0A0L7M8X0_PLAF4|nr:hypothetical protein PFDG_04830 [Plasmodium falciparum Dd2]